MGIADQQSLFAPDPDREPVKPPGDRPVAMRVLITVKAAPNPSETYGETVCVAGIRLDEQRTGWVRLYPINFRELETDQQFRKYDIVSLQARPSSKDPRPESFRPLLNTVQTVGHLSTWPQRRPFIVDQVHESMCEVLAGVRANPPGRCRSLAAVRPRVVKRLEIRPHPGWTPGEQAKIDQYTGQLDLLESTPRTALQAPRFKGWYHYRCQSPRCNGHHQGVYDWEFVRLQRRLREYDDAQAEAELRKKFFEQMYRPDKDLVFYVGNQAKHAQTFMVLGTYYPKR
jgi:hypothetical protein